MKYRKKPVIIDAIKFEYSESGIEKLKEFYIQFKTIENLPLQVLFFYAIL
jgi:hypothetical protein